MQPLLDRAVVSASAGEKLGRMASRLAPIHCAGFEVRLAGPPSAVDLVQRISAVRGEPGVLGAHIRAASLARVRAWARLCDFCETWAQPTSFVHRMIAGVFLELDAEADHRGVPSEIDTSAGEHDAAAPIPSIYLTLEPGTGGSMARVRRLLTRTADSLRGAPFSAELLDAVEAVHAASPPGATLTDVGFMLSRRLDAVRLVLSPLSAAEALQFLAETGWPGRAAELEAAAMLLPPGSEDLTLSLDVGPRLLPRLGIEYYPGSLAAQGSHWQAALDRLVANGACTVAKRDALLRWPGYLEPDDGTAWPPSLLVESLLSRQDQFNVLARRLTFLKVVCQPGAAPEAKAYFGYGPRSFVPEALAASPEAVPPQPRPGQAEHGNGGDRVGTIASGTEPPTPRFQPALHDAAAVIRDAPAAIEAGLDWLLAQRQAGGGWREFPRVLAGTDEWVTAYIGQALAGLREARGREAAALAWGWLGEQRRIGEGWGYNGTLPEDADSTSWALRLGTALGEKDSRRARGAADVIEGHLLESGGVATYRRQACAGLRAVFGDSRLDGLFVAHTCATAAAAGLAAFAPRLCSFLAHQQEEDGRWRGYWWSDDDYTTALAAAALVATDPKRYRRHLRAAAAWAAARIDRSGAAWSRGLGGPSAFATALCLQTIVQAGNGAAAAPRRAAAERAAIAWLLAAQRTDGSWAPAALMRMPPTDATDGDERPAATCVSVDDQALFTTATVMASLALALDQAGDRHRSRGGPHRTGAAASSR
jgi:hypothetical protein